LLVANEIPWKRRWRRKMFVAKILVQPLIVEVGITMILVVAMIVTAVTFVEIDFGLVVVVVAVAAAVVAAEEMFATYLAVSGSLIVI
jgi:hypothetical protein